MSAFDHGLANLPDVCMLMYVCYILVILVIPAVASPQLLLMPVL